MLFRRGAGRALALALTVAALSAAQVADAYTVTLIHPTYAGAGSFSAAYGISQNGKVTGIGTVSIASPWPGPPPNNKGLAFLWTPTAANGTVQSTYTQTGTFLTAFGATGSAAWTDHSISYGTAVNNSGQVVGRAANGGSGNLWGFYWNGSTTTPNPTSTKGYKLTNGLSGSAYRESDVSGAYGISPIGTIAASAPFPAPNTNYGVPIGTIVSSQGIIVPYGSTADPYAIGFPFGLDPNGCGMSWIKGVNDYEQLCGSANTTANLGQVPMLRSASGTFYNLGLPSGATYGIGDFINNEGEIVVECSVGWRLWQPTTTRGTTGSYISIPGAPAGYAITPRAISRSGGAALVVGSASYGNPVVDTYAWKWTPGGSIQNLNTLYPTANFTFTSAEGVNDYGQIVGYGQWTSGGQTYQRAFIINP